jgi:hypothetical protein
VYGPADNTRYVNNNVTNSHEYSAGTTDSYSYAATSDSYDSYQYTDPAAASYHHGDSAGNEHIQTAPVTMMMHIVTPEHSQPRGSEQVISTHGTLPVAPSAAATAAPNSARGHDPAHVVLPAKPDGGSVISGPGPKFAAVVLSANGETGQVEDDQTSPMPRTVDSGRVDLSPQMAGGLVHMSPLDLAALGQGVREFFEKVDGLAVDAATARDRLWMAPWFTGAIAMTLTFELARRQALRRHMPRELAMAMNWKGRTWSWHPRMDELPVDFS